MTIQVHTKRSLVRNEALAASLLYSIPTVIVPDPYYQFDPSGINQAPVAGYYWWTPTFGSMGMRLLRDAGGSHFVPYGSYTGFLLTSAEHLQLSSPVPLSPPDLNYFTVVRNWQPAPPLSYGSTSFIHSGYSDKATGIIYPSTGWSEFVTMDVGGVESIYGSAEGTPGRVPTGGDLILRGSYGGDLPGVSVNGVYSHIPNQSFAWDTIGYVGNPARPLHGVIMELRIYNQYLTTDQINAIEAELNAKYAIY